MKLPENVTVKTTLDGEVKLQYLKEGIFYTLVFEPDDAYTVGLALVSASYESQKKEKL